MQKETLQSRPFMLSSDRRCLPLSTGPHRVRELLPAALQSCIRTCSTHTPSTAYQHTLTECRYSLVALFKDRCCRNLQLFLFLDYRICNWFNAKTLVSLRRNYHPDKREREFLFIFSVHQRLLSLNSLSLTG